MNAKTCSKCSKTLPITDFYASRDKHRAECKECYSDSRKKKYREDDNHRAKKLATAKSYQKGQRLDYQIRILSILKSSGCIDCGEKDPIVLDFDHMRDKVSAISVMVRNHTSWDMIANEISKCEVRCSNCHRRKTAKDFNYYSDIDLDSLPIV